MTPEQYQRIGQLFDEALEQPAAQRASWLKATCGDNPALHAEVEKLLSHHSESEQFLSRPAMHVAAEMLAQNPATEANASAVGKQISHYEVSSLLGAGGMGEVYLAQDLQLKRNVALKLLPTRFIQDTEHIQRFKREALAASALNHPNIVTIYEFGTEAEIQFMATEFVQGETLRQFIAREQISVAKTLDIATQLVSALAAAHEAKIIHRDIKPENIMLRQDGIVKVLDFGLAKLLETSASNNNGAAVSLTTQVGRVVGTAAYMSPEQARGLPIDARSDLFAVGVILFEMLTGKHPFLSETVNHTIVAILEKELPPLAAYGLSVPNELEQILRQTLAKNVEARYQSAQALLRDLKHLARHWESSAENPPALPVAQHSEIATQPIQLQTMQGQGNLTMAHTAQSSVDLAHVLFCDIVGYSLLPIDRQTQVMQTLQKIVQETADYRRAQQKGQLVRLPSGDGMALAFLQDVTAPVRCACEIAKALQTQPDIKLRMGIHSGPVYQSADINANRNVVGSGVNLAQRVMDCGDAGHILVSRNIAEVLEQVSHWQTMLHDLGEHEVKHGAKIHLYNLYNDELGNAAMPVRLQSNAPSKIANNDLLLPQTQSAVAASTRNNRKIIWGTAALLLAGIVSVPVWQIFRPKNPATTIPTAQPERTISYFLTVQRYRNGKPFQTEFRSSGREIFEQGWQFKLNVSSPQEGFLYLLNEDPDGNYVLLFPLPSRKEGSAHLAAQESFQTGAYVFDQQAGTEHFRLVWAAQPVPELESLRALLNQTKQGRVTDPAQIQAVRNFIAQHANSPTNSNKDAQNQQTIISGQGSVIVALIELEHR